MKKALSSDVSAEETEDSFTLSLSFRAAEVTRTLFPQYEVNEERIIRFSSRAEYEKATRLIQGTLNYYSAETPISHMRYPDSPN